MPSGFEFGFIDWIRGQTRQRPEVALGIGDDAAILHVPPDAETLVAVDTLMEGVHFTFPEATPERAGRKALAVNLSDIAAMAGEPWGVLFSVCLPRRRGRKFAEAVFAGLRELADAFDVAVVGGDTNTWDGPLVLSVTVLGASTGRGAVTRSGAQPGDWICVTGMLGGSLAGRHLDFTPRIVEARQLHAATRLHAMIDLSDGLASDLRHLLEQSQVGAVVCGADIPIHPAAQQADDQRSRLDHALGDGEDFELLFTLSPEAGARLLAAPPCAVPLTRIGTITRERECLLELDGRRAPLQRGGWQHHLDS